jgi:hypothetical protein
MYNTRNSVDQIQLAQDRVQWSMDFNKHDEELSRPETF